MRVAFSGGAAAMVLAAVALQAALPGTAAADGYFGSGDGDDDEDGGFGRTVVPTRVVPSLRSPLPSGPGEREEDWRDAGGKTSTDSIYLEEEDDDAGGDRYGSGLGEDVTPSWRGGGNSPPSFVTTPTPELGGRSPGPTSGGGGAIVTDRLANSPPVLQRKLQKLAVVVGKSFRRRVPEDTFRDEEDGGTRKLRLSLRWPNGSTVASSANSAGSWIKFDEKTQELRLLPTDENDVGRWNFRLTATDRQGQSASDELEIVVRQFPGSRLINHYFEIAFAFASRTPAALRNWEWRVLDRTARFLGDKGLEQMLVRDVGLGPGLHYVRWTNTSLIQRGSCPKGEIQDLLALMAEDGGAATLELAQALAPLDVMIKEVSVNYLGSCLAPVAPPPSKPEDAFAGGAGNNKVPVIRNPLDRLNVRVGELLRYRVPEDTCYDREDGATPALSLQLLTVKKRELSPDSWLRFDARNQEFFGIPLEEEAGREEYQLVCSDHSGLSAIDGLEVNVLNRPFSERFGVEFAVRFTEDISRDRVALVDGPLPAYFGDSGPGQVVVKSVEGNQLVWVNKSLAYAPCDDPRVEWIRQRLLDPNPPPRRGQAGGPSPASGAPSSASTSLPGAGGGGAGGPPEDSAPHPALVRQLAPRFKVVGAAVRIRPSCHPTDRPDVVPGRGGDAAAGDEGAAGGILLIFHGLIPSSEYLLTFLVPAVIIVCMLVLAVCLACLLHRKRKAGKLNLFYSEALPPRVPVILQDELYDDGGGNVVDPSAYRMQPQVRPASSQQHRPAYEDHPATPLMGGGGQSLPRPTPVYRRQ